jgi:secreted PhoX family phosphatase
LLFFFFLKQQPHTLHVHYKLERSEKLILKRADLKKGDCTVINRKGVPISCWIVVLTVLSLSAPQDGAAEQGFRTQERAMLTAVNTSKDAQWEVFPLLTIGEQSDSGADLNAKRLGYRPPGVLDGIGAFALDDQTLRVLVNHELAASSGYPYRLSNGTPLSGARVSYFDIDLASRVLKTAGLAYDRVIDRGGREVLHAVQIDEGFNGGGFDSFCSAHAVRAADSEFQSDIYFTGEEVAEFGEEAAEGFGGQAVAIDVKARVAYVVPMLGRAAFENVATIETGSGDKIALLIGDDRQAGPVYLYIGQKGARPKVKDGYQPPEFLVKNGLGFGRLFVWVADNGERTPDRFHGSGEQRRGQFLPIKHFDPVFSAQENHDGFGFVSLALQDIRADALGAFMFSRPEDIAVNPANPAQIVMASTGRGGVFSDVWGMLYRIDIDLDKEGLGGSLEAIEGIPATITILFDGNEAGPGASRTADFAVRSPDNLDWAEDGNIYIQEDRATVPGGLFGKQSGREASVWQMNPNTGGMSRILEMDRSALPAGQTDMKSATIGAWESSGVVDVSRYFRPHRGASSHSEPVTLLMTVQAHGLQPTWLGAMQDLQWDLVEGGQLLLVQSK